MEPRFRVALWPSCSLPEARSKLCPRRLLTRSLILQLHRPRPLPGAPAPRQQLGPCSVLLLSRLLGHKSSVGAGRKKGTTATGGCCLPRPCSGTHMHHLLVASLGRSQSCASCALIRGGLSFSSLSCSCFKRLPRHACGRAGRSRCLKDLFPAFLFTVPCCGNQQVQRLLATGLRLAATRPFSLQATAAAALARPPRGQPPHPALTCGSTPVASSGTSHTVSQSEHGDPLAS